MKLTAWSGLACLLLAGCAWTGTSNLADDETMGQIKVGETTRLQVLSLLGDPDGQMAIELGGSTREWWSYSYASATINPIDYVLLYGFLFNGIGLYDTRYDVGVFFDHRGIVSSLSRTKTDYDMGSPFTSLRISSIANSTIGFPDVKDPVHFEDKSEFLY
jgi:hypothetical protein